MLCCLSGASCHGLLARQETLVTVKVKPTSMEEWQASAILGQSLMRSIGKPGIAMRYFSFTLHKMRTATEPSMVLLADSYEFFSSKAKALVFF
jgi:hypothetical protein